MFCVVAFWLCISPITLLFAAYGKKSIFNWENISDVLHWYKEIDICQLKQVSGDVREYHLNECKASKRHLACDANQGGIGLGGPKRFCYPPFNRREFFWKALHNYSDHKINYINSILTQLKRDDRALLFIGDSITYQSVDAFICEAYRSEPSQVA